MTANLEQRAIEAALETWRALPDDERNGERSYIMGFNAGWEEAGSALKGQPASSGWEGVASELHAALKHVLDGALSLPRFAEEEGRAALNKYRALSSSPPEPAAPELGG